HADAHARRLVVAAEAPQRLHGAVARDPVDLEADVALELLDGSLGQGAEETVLRAAVEAQLVEAALQLPDVVPAHHRGAAPQQAITEAVSGFHQGAPRLRPHDAVRGQAAVALEAADGIERLRSED